MPAMELSEEVNTASQRVIEALASAGNTDPLEMTTPLYEVVDPDALNALLDTDAPVEIQFEYEGRAVVVRSDGQVSVDRAVYTNGETVAQPSQNLHR